MSETDRQEYLKYLPDLGVEMCLSGVSMPNGVNVCLLKRSGEIALEAKLLFAIQMKWHTIVIPVLSDNYKSGEKVNIKIRCNKKVSIRKIDFTEVENDFVCDMTGKAIEIPDELFPELEENLRNSGLLKNR